MPTLRPLGSPRLEVFDPQPTMPLVNPRKREFLSVGLSVPPKPRCSSGKSTNSLRKPQGPSKLPGWARGVMEHARSERAVSLVPPAKDVLNGTPS